MHGSLSIPPSDFLLYFDGVIYCHLLLWTSHSFVVDKMPAVTKPVLPPLQTPKTASFPSEIVETPLTASCISAVIKQEQGLKTPITPPVAYTDFLKALTPILASPPTSALHRSLSDESSATRESISSIPSTASSLSAKSENHRASFSSIPPTPNSRKASITTLKRLRIPHSPAFSPSTCGPSPRTGMTSAGMVFSPYSPADWGFDNAALKFLDTPRSACSKPVSVRSVVTRTVTYKRSPPLEPAPKGKKRKLDTSSISGSENGSSMSPPSTAATPAAVA